jgi:hypothetical protein
MTVGEGFDPIIVTPLQNFEFLVAILVRTYIVGYQREAGIRSTDRRNQRKLSCNIAACLH